jgi:phosphoribosylanthranilate isomerase
MMPSSKEKNILNMVHFNSRNKNFSEEVITLFKELKGVCNTIQININTPYVEEFKKIKESIPKLDILFQVNTTMLRENTNEEILSIIKGTYLQYISYILIDPSGGAGKEMDKETYERSIELYKALQDTGLVIGFAGGYTPDNVRKNITDINNSLSNAPFSIDIETGVRDKLSDKYGDDIFNIKKVEAYISNTL